MAKQAFPLLPLPPLPLLLPHVRVSPVRIRALRARLLRWFDHHQRDLPWRRTRDPYRIWLAETMLQQTRVPVVVHYYRRFLRAFPTVRRLAAARLDRVLALWAGLGYYQRARNLHRAARAMLRRHGGRFPQSLEAALRLPGIGPYTARAILSIACAQPHAVVDGNVARVLARLFRLPMRDSVTGRTKLQLLADRLVSPARPGDYNQALMELGSTLCLPKYPRCSLCPLENLCAARQAGIEHRWPPRLARRARPRRRLAVLVVRREGHLLVTREHRGLFSGLWHFPYARLSGGASLPAPLRNHLHQLRARLESPQPIARLKHAMTTGDLGLSVFAASAGPDGPAPRLASARWVSASRLAQLGVGSATRKILAALNLPRESGV